MRNNSKREALRARAVKLEDRAIEVAESSNDPDVARAELQLKVAVLLRKREKELEFE